MDPGESGVIAQELLDHPGDLYDPGLWVCGVLVDGVFETPAL